MIDIARELRRLHPGELPPDRSNLDLISFIRESLMHGAPALNTGIDVDAEHVILRHVSGRSRHAYFEANVALANGGVPSCGINECTDREMRPAASRARTASCRRACPKGAQTTCRCPAPISSINQHSQAEPVGMPDSVVPSGYHVHDEQVRTADRERVPPLSTPLQ